MAKRTKQADRQREAAEKFRKLVEAVSQLQLGLPRYYGPDGSLSEIELPTFEVQPPTSHDVPPANGPFGDDGFVYDGHPHHGLTRYPFKLLKLLWDQRGKTASYKEVAIGVYGSDDEVVSDNRTGGLRKHLNKFFVAKNIPFNIRITGNTSVTLAKGLPKPRKRRTRPKVMTNGASRPRKSP